MQRLKGAELLRDGQRGVVGQHDTAGAESDCAGVGRDVRDQHTGRRGGDAGHVVVLGVPDAAVTPPLGALRQGDTGGEAVPRRIALSNVREIENGQWNNHGQDNLSSRRRYGIVALAHCKQRQQRGPYSDPVRGS
jgi:hypothetical protein